MNKIIPKIKDIIRSFDSFPVTASLRTNGSPQYKSTINGCISILIYCVTCVLFIQALIDLYSYNSITFTQSNLIVPLDQIKDKDIMFAVGIGNSTNAGTGPGNQTDTSLQQYFQIYWKNQALQTEGYLRKCKTDDWTQYFEEQTEQQFQKNKLGQKLCPQGALKLTNKATSSNQTQQIQFHIQKCNSSSCTQPANETQLNQLIFSQGQHVTLNFIFLQKQVQPDKKSPYRNIVKRIVGGIFSVILGYEIYVQFGSIDVKTDLSSYPIYQQEQSLIGTFIASVNSLSYSRDPTQAGADYSRFSFQLSQEILIFQRQIGKFDSILSYVGGLLATFIGAGALFFQSYNQHRYQLSVAQQIYSQQNPDFRLDDQKYSYWKLFKYSLYNMYCCCLKNKGYFKMSDYYDDVFEETNKVMDTALLLRNISCLQKSMGKVLKKQQFVCFSLMKSETIEEKKLNRMMLQYYNKIIQKLQVNQTKTLRQWKTSSDLSQSYEKQKISSDSLNEPNTQQKTSKYIMDTSRSNEQYRKNLTKQQLYDTLSRRFPQLVLVASNLDIQMEFKPVQAQISQHYFNLSPNVREMVQENIPIVILLRLSQKDVNKQQMGRERNRRVIFPMVQQIQ